ncbi:SIS domain-containing protein [Bacillus massilinigeriensis]|uniref:SIS domain-containing protein n=1 Tax=Bacillus massilionigeriensis TaxID=1805475 RepID=UPI00096B51BE|nr:SIS domain-containing protein [Bacillus massilionigeriensis]
MLDIDKSTVEFLITDHMANEVKLLLNEKVNEVDIIVQEMKSRKINRVYFVACGSPLCACQTAQILFDRYSKIIAKSYSGFDFLDQTPYVIDENTLVIGVSDSGTTEEVYRSIDLARAKGAMTVGFSRDGRGVPLGDSAEYAIGYQGHAIWQMHLYLTYLIACKYIQLVEGDNKELTEILKQLQELPDVLKALVQNQEEKAKQLGIEASKYPFLYTVSGGNLLPLAYKEGIITMLEFTRTHGCHLNAAEFRHGPLEVVEAGVPYVFLLGNDESRHTVERALEFVKGYTDDVVVFDVKDLGVEVHPMIAPLVLFVPLEYFYYYLSIAKDHNPDDRRYYGGKVKY